MFNLKLDLKIENIFKSKDFTDKESGQVTKAKYKIQTFDKIQTEEGEQIKLIDISIPDSVYYSLKDRIGEIVSLSVGTYVNGGRVGFYGLENNSDIINKK